MTLIMTPRRRVPAKTARKFRSPTEFRDGRAVFMQLLVVALTGFTESERFERWSHYKDISLPGTVHLSVSFKEPGRPAFVPTGMYDTIDQAAIADGACRMLPDASYSGYTYWHYPERVRRVLEALEAAPSSQGPSVFTLSTNATLTR